MAREQGQVGYADRLGDLGYRQPPEAIIAQYLLGLLQPQLEQLLPEAFAIFGEELVKKAA
ncbi:hypothetical protein [Novosphingobium sp.]|uniref:hypothetical protein n=1 Tax=Novosphingobium sp. TaxID=1874826 RepID=UPI003BA9C85D